MPRFFCQLGGRRCARPSLCGRRQQPRRWDRLTAHQRLTARAATRTDNPCRPRNGHNAFLRPPLEHKVARAEHQRPASNLLSTRRAAAARAFWAFPLTRAGRIPPPARPSSKALGLWQSMLPGGVKNNKALAVVHAGCRFTAHHVLPETMCHLVGRRRTCEKQGASSSLRAHAEGGRPPCAPVRPRRAAPAP